MRDPMQLRDIFLSDVTRDIPPVVYFHEQTPQKLANEVAEYIVTGGWEQGHPNQQRVPQGIHEQYVKLITGITAELEKPGGPELPTAWISGFYGSGKSSFAKLFGLALDGVALPGGGSLAEAWLLRDTSPKRQELRTAWDKLRQKVDPIAVVFDIGSVARDNEHIHAAAVRQVQRRLGYCSSEPLVADFELNLERRGEWARFEETALQVLKQPWGQVRDRALAEEDFSLVMSVMEPEKYTDPMAWFMSRAGTHTRMESPEEAVTAIKDMLRFRQPKATLFLVVDEVSQYILSNKDRVDRLRAFATALGAGLRGQAWLLALGQQKLDEQADDAFLVWARDRFPQRLQVHLAATNIKDVVHKRLLQKKPEVEASLRALFEANRADLKLHGYKCENVTPDEFVEVYPMLPEQIDLILQITTQLRTRSARAQGDDQAIRGLLQLLGELFRDQKLADQPLGALVTLDQIYEVQHTALESDVQTSMARILNQCAHQPDDLLIRAAKAVALLELIQETVPTDARLVAQCLYDRVDRGDRTSEVTAALEELRRRNLLGYSEKHGYKLQSTAGEDWERERRDLAAAREQVAEILRDGLKYLLATVERPRLQARSFLWAGVFGDGRQLQDAVLVDPPDEAAVKVDFRFLPPEDRAEADWLRKSAETGLHDRLVWVCGDVQRLDEVARDLFKSRRMAQRYQAGRDSLPPAKRLLLQAELNRAEDLEPLVREAIAEAWIKGRLYFRGRVLVPADLGPAFAASLLASGNRILPDLFPHIVATQVQPSELMQLLNVDLTGLSAKFLDAELGIVQLDQGRYVAGCEGVVPKRVQEFVEAEQGVGGTTLLAHFGGPPYGYAANVVKACVAGLLRGGKLRIQPEGAAEITAPRDAGVLDLFEKDRPFRRALYFPGGGEGALTAPERVRICKLLEQHFALQLEREDHAIADAVATHFPTLGRQLQGVQARLNQLPGRPAQPAALDKLSKALEASQRQLRQTGPTVQAVAKHLDALRDGLQVLRAYDAELTDATLKAVRSAVDVRDYQLAQLRATGALDAEAEAAAARIEAQLATERPWQEIAALQPDLELVKAAYAAERRHLLARQEQQAEATKGRLKGRDGFSTLTAEKAHQVLRPITSAVTDTSADAVAPLLADLRDPFEVALKKAEADAHRRLDELVDVLVVELDLGLTARELKTEADVEALVTEIRGRLVAQLGPNKRIRLL